MSAVKNNNGFYINSCLLKSVNIPAFIENNFNKQQNLINLEK